MSLRGYIDGVIGDELVGWALDDDAPERRLLVRGELHGVLLGTVEASEPRHDLVTAGFGDGSYGFRIALDRALLTPGVHPVAAIVGEQSLPLAQDWIVRDEQEQPVESVQLAAGVPGSATPAPEPAAALEPEPVPEDAVASDGSARLAPERVLTGAAGWTFVVSGEAPERSHARLDADAAAIEELHALAASLGIVVRAVAVPAKHLLYAEHLPPDQRIDPRDRWARTVEARLRDSDEASLLDLYDALQDARAHGRLYPRSGRSLTWTGAIHAYRAIAKSLGGAVEGWRPQPIDAFEFGRLVAVPDALDSADTEPLLTTRPSAASRGAPTGLIVHDGTAGRITEFLRMNFWRCEVVAAERVDPELVRRAGADVVIWIREDR